MSEGYLIEGLSPGESVTVARSQSGQYFIAGVGESDEMQITPDMVERGAKGLAAQRGAPWDELQDFTKAHILIEARACIEAASGGGK